MKKIFYLLSALVLVIGLSISPRAELIDMGDETIYDTDSQITWLKDAGMAGVKNWDDAKEWADNLVFAGLDNWRLPIVIDQIHGYNITSSEMGYLYYIGLGNPAGILINTGPFINLYGPFWTDTEYSLNPDRAWGFCFNCGDQWHDHKYDYLRVWVVSPGERLEPNIAISPLEYDFEGVVLGIPTTVIATITNDGEGVLNVDDIYLEGSSIFDFEVQSPLPFSLLTGEEIGVNITCDPFTLYDEETDTLIIINDDPDEEDQSIMLNLKCRGVLSDDSYEAVQGLLIYIQQSVDEGVLYGQSTGSSANNRLNSFIEMIELVGDLIDENKVKQACDQLQSAFKRVDGSSNPHDFVEGEATNDVTEGIIQIMNNLLCL